MTKKREEIENKETEIKVVEKHKKKTPVVLIISVSIIVSLAIIISSILPFFVTFGFLSFFEEDVDFKTVDNNRVEIPSENMIIEKTNDYYAKEDECYVLQFKVDHEKEDKKKTTFFSSWNSTLEVTYFLKDKDGYVIGEELLILDDFDSYDKVKKNIYYCDDNAKNVDNVEVKKITVY